MPTYQTHTGLTLTRVKARVTLSGENTKVLYQGDDLKPEDVAEAFEVYRDTRAHYEERKKDELSG